MHFFSVVMPAFLVFSIIGCGDSSKESRVASVTSFTLYPGVYFRLPREKIQIKVAPRSENTRIISLVGVEGNEPFIVENKPLGWALNEPDCQIRIAVEAASRLYVVQKGSCKKYGFPQEPVALNISGPFALN